jgi:hypothetical protein
VAANDASPTGASTGAALATTPSREHPYIAARVANRAGSFAGLQKVGMLSAALSTIGLSMLRKRGKQGAGAALVAGAVGISLLKRED